MIPLPEAVSAELLQLESIFELVGSSDKGANGYMYFGTNRTSGQKVAIKFYAGEPGEHEHREPQLLNQINSPNVLKILHAKSIGDGWAYFMTPYCPDGDLDNLLLSKPSFHKSIDIALGICHGMSALHAQRLVHRDLKLGNIVMLDGQPQIADFGSVKYVEVGASAVSGSRHSLLYRPPESFSDDQYSFSGDIYQIGLILYQLWGGFLPYDLTKYLDRKTRPAFEGITDTVDAGIYLDGVIRTLAESGRLISMKTVEPWVTTQARQLIRDMTSPTATSRPDSVAEVSARLTMIRSRTKDWGWQADVATFRSSGKTVELRPAGEELYQAWQSKNSGIFRKVPVIPAASLAELVKNWK